MFTLAHELAHLWLGESALSDASPVCSPLHAVEAWGNRVAAELLVPLAALRECYRPGGELRQEVERLARIFKVSTLVVLRRIHDMGGLSRGEFATAYDQELSRLRAIPRGTGGDFYLTQSARLGSASRGRWSPSLEGADASTVTRSPVGDLQAATSAICFNAGGCQTYCWSEVFIQSVEPSLLLDVCLSSPLLGLGDREQARPQVFSIEKVGDELEAGADDGGLGRQAWPSLLSEAGSPGGPCLGDGHSWLTDRGTTPCCRGTSEGARYYLLAMRSRTGHVVGTQRKA
jgi:hypothetical protein